MADTMSQFQSHYAMQIAVHTLKDRCQTLQKRVAFLEEENAKLLVKRTSYTREEKDSLSEIDRLNAHIVLLTEQNQQLIQKFREVTDENKELWNKLNKLNSVNQNLGSKLSELSDSIIQHSNQNKEKSPTIPPLIRSRTFTQDRPQTKVLQKNLEENGRITSELEEISLKIINSFAQGKQELESLCSNIDLLSSENVFTESFGFYYDEDLEATITEEFGKVLNELKQAKDALIKQQHVLKLALKKVKKLEEIIDSKSCDKKEVVDTGTNTVQETGEIDSLMGSPSIETNDSEIMICPVCSKTYPQDRHTFSEFQIHVEEHFTERTTPDYEIL